MFDYEKIHNEVEDYLGLFADDFDIDAIVAELSDYKPVETYFEDKLVEMDFIRSVDDVDPDDFTDILQRHDVSKGSCLAAIEYSGDIAPYEFVTITK